MLSYETLKNKAREFLAATGLRVEEFQQLLPAFESAYEKCYPSHQTVEGEPRRRRAGGGARGLLNSSADRLLFILIYEKTNPLQTMHGLQFGLSQPQTHYWIHQLLPVLQQALADLGMRPEREAGCIAASPLALEGTSDLAIDGSERRRQRPKDAELQKAHYSGKKKAHTDKNLLLVNEDTGKVVYLSPTGPGKTHDKKLADEAVISYPCNATLDKDTGFQGYEPEGVITRQPKKKPKGKALSIGDKFLNRIFSSARIEVEHVISGVKRCRIVKDVLRLTKKGISDLVMEIACGLHNFRVSCRRSLETFDLLSFASSA